MTRPTEQWAYRIGETVYDEMELYQDPNINKEEFIAAIAKHALAANPFLPQWVEDEFQHEWNLKYPYPFMPHVREATLNPDKYYAVGTCYDNIDEAKIAAEKELMRRIKK